MSAFNRENAYKPVPLDPANIPGYQLAENQRPTKESQDVYTAATKGDVHKLKSSLTAGGKPNWYNNVDEGATALHRAANGGHAECIKLLLANGAAIDERLLTNQSSPLHLACANGHLDAVKVLVQEHALVNTGNGYGNAPIQSALIGGHRAVVEYLLEEGTDLKWTNNKGSTLLHFLAYSPMSEGDKEAVGKKFIAGGVDVDASDNDGMTALHVVGRSGDRAMATFLFENGANHTLKDSKGKTPLQWAQLNSHTAVGLLLSNSKSSSKSCGAAA